MRRSALLLSIAAAIAVPAFGQHQEIEPTAFESFVARPGERMQGVRLTLQNNTTFEHLYLDAGELAVAKSELAEIESGIKELKSGTDAPYRVQGTGRCWKPERPMRILCPDYRVGPDGSGLGLGILGGSGFSFPGRKPSELGALIDQAAAALDAPRHAP